MRWVDRDVRVQSLSHVWLSVTPWTSSSVHGIFKARIMEWVVISSSRGSSLPRDQICVACIGRHFLYHWATCQAHLLGISSALSRVHLFATPWTAARQASLSITNSRSLLKPMSIKSVIPSNHLILCHPLFLLTARDVVVYSLSCVRLLRPRGL